MNPHDALFKAAFGQPDVARSELEFILAPEVRAQLDLATLEVCPGSFVDDELRHAHTDLLYGVQARTGGEALVYILFEHQSSFDAVMPLRLLRYVVRIWERWLRDHPATRVVPVVLPVVLHHGATGWQAAPELAAMIDASPELLDAARPYLPLFRFVIDDLAALTLDALSSRTLHALTRLVQLAFWSSRSFERLEAAAPVMRRINATIVRDERARTLLQQLYLYLMVAARPEVDDAAVRTILFEVAGPEGREDLMSLGEKLIEQGREQGRAEAADALRAAIVAVFAARATPLSEVGRARVAACGDLATLTEWLARAVTASSEPVVFAEATTGRGL